MRKLHRFGPVPNFPNPSLTSLFFFSFSVFASLPHAVAPSASRRCPPLPHPEFPSTCCSGCWGCGRLSGPSLNFSRKSRLSSYWWLLLWTGKLVLLWNWVSNLGFRGALKGLFGMGSGGGRCCWVLRLSNPELKQRSFNQIGVWDYEISLKIRPWTCSDAMFLSGGRGTELFSKWQSRIHLSFHLNKEGHLR